jgi:hypothetical protein
VALYERGECAKQYRHWAGLGEHRAIAIFRWNAGGTVTGHEDERDAPLCEGGGDRQHRLSMQMYVELGGIDPYFLRDGRRAAPTRGNGPTISHPASARAISQTSSTMSTRRPASVGGEAAIT